VVDHTDVSRYCRSVVTWNGTVISGMLHVCSFQSGPILRFTRNSGVKEARPVTLSGRMYTSSEPMSDHKKTRLDTMIHVRFYSMFRLCYVYETKIAKHYIVCTNKSLLQKQTVLHRMPVRMLLLHISINGPFSPRMWNQNRNSAGLISGGYSGDRRAAVWSSRVGVDVSKYM